MLIFSKVVKNFIENSSKIAIFKKKLKKIEKNKKSWKIVKIGILRFLKGGPKIKKALPWTRGQKWRVKKWQKKPFF